VAEIKRTVVWSRPWAKWLLRSYLGKTHHHRSRCRPWIQTPVPQKAKQTDKQKSLSHSLYCSFRSRLMTVEHVTWPRCSKSFQILVPTPQILFFPLTIWLNIFCFLSKGKISTYVLPLFHLLFYHCFNNIFYFLFPLAMADDLLRISWKEKKKHFL
jgi:hypothetical protein